MSELAIIGGTGLRRLEGLEVTHRVVQKTPFGEPSGPLIHGELNQHKVVFLARHGLVHRIPPHKVNYRANIWALRELGVERIIAAAAVGGITPQIPPGSLVIPDQIIDYTWGRQHTFFEDDLSHVTHIDFTWPYSQELRLALLEAAAEAGIEAHDGGTYGATQGPRLESAAEIDRMDSDGCDLVGMTGMPEAALARELGLDYVSCCVVANWAAGRGEGEITMQAIEANLISGMEKLRRVLEMTIPRL